MTIVVTGGSGFLGAWIVRRLVAQDDEVRIFDRNPDDTLLRVLGVDVDAIEWMSGDVASTTAVQAALTGASAVIHLAAALTPACREDRLLGARVNLIGTLNILECALRQQMSHVVYSSSVEAIGTGDASHPDPTTHYGVFKLACEGAARAYWREFGLASVGLRPGIIYGPGRERGATAGVTLACRAAALGQEFTIPFTGPMALEYVDDVASYFVAAATAASDGAQVFTSGGDICSTDEIITSIEQAVPGARIRAEGPVLPFAPPAGGGDPAQLGPAVQKTTLELGFGHTIDHYRRRTWASPPVR